MNNILVKDLALACCEAEHNRQRNLFQTYIERNRIWSSGNHVEYAEGVMAIKLGLNSI